MGRSFVDVEESGVALRTRVKNASRLRRPDSPSRPGEGEQLATRYPITASLLSPGPPIPSRALDAMLGGYVSKITPWDPGTIVLRQLAGKEYRDGKMVEIALYAIEPGMLRHDPIASIGILAGELRKRAAFVRGAHE